ncbi:MAG: M23 family metallopeptidase [Spirochaetaceae bacterium]|nr:MAG: M23 family metallopeptidase [Spirochaetaceae bacterium]
MPPSTEMRYFLKHDLLEKVSMSQDTLTHPRFHRMPFTLNRGNIAMTLLLLAVVLVLGSCRTREIVEEAYEPSASHEEYRRSLMAMELDDTALGRAWLSQADAALEAPHTISIPFQEIAHFEPSRPEAVGFRFEALRGQRIEILLEIEDGEQGKMFADVFRAEEGGANALPQVASYSDELNRLEFEPRRDSEYILRLQPELLRGGRYSVRIQSVPVMSFPVQDHGIRHIWSFFGDSRGGGTRVHEGVDVFAPRGTPVLSSVYGTVRNVGTRDLGGLVVSITDEERGLVLYYAHLEEQLTQRGARVAPGDIIGTVGNTGNAITTPPHLHFGIYEPGWRAIDPWNFLYEFDTEPPAIAGATNKIGGAARVAVEGVSLMKTTPEAQAFSLSYDTPVVILGASAASYRVVLQDGRTGYIPVGVLEATDEPVRIAQAFNAEP